MIDKRELIEGIIEGVERLERLEERIAELDTGLQAAKDAQAQAIVDAMPTGAWTLATGSQGWLAGRWQRRNGTGYQ